MPKDSFLVSSPNVDEMISAIRYTEDGDIEYQDKNGEWHDSSSMAKHQKLVIGKNNIIIGKGNTVIGDNNLVIGSNCYVSGRFKVIIGNDRFDMVSGAPGVGYDYYNGNMAVDHTSQIPLFNSDYDALDPDDPNSEYGKVNSVFDPLPTIGDRFVIVKDITWYGDNDFTNETIRLENTITQIVYDDENLPWGVLETPLPSYDTLDGASIEGNYIDNIQYNTYPLYIGSFSNTSVTFPNITLPVKIKESIDILSDGGTKHKFDKNGNIFLLSDSYSGGTISTPPLINEYSGLTILGGHICAGKQIAMMNSDNYLKHSISIGSYVKMFHHAVPLSSSSISGSTCTCVLANDDYISEFSVGAKIAIPASGKSGAIGHWNRRPVFYISSVKSVNQSTRTIQFYYTYLRNDFGNKLPFPVIFPIVDHQRTGDSDNYTHDNKFSMIAGSYSAAGGASTFTFGTGLVNGVNNHVMIGTWACATDNNDAFTIGNGTGPSKEISYNQLDSITWNTGKAFRVTKQGATYANGAYSSTGADYAEFFEWEDGNPNDEDRVGYFVTLNADKINVANAIDDILGIVSSNPAIIGDNHDMQWNSKYLMDAFGRIQYEDVLIQEERMYYHTRDELIELGQFTIPAPNEATPEERAMRIKELNDYLKAHPESSYDKEETLADGTTRKYKVVQCEHYEQRPIINPDWDPNKEYIPRSKRKEWAAVGVIGKLPLRDDGTCMPGQYCKPADGGIATHSDEKTKYYVMKRLDENIVLVWLK